MNVAFFLKPKSEVAYLYDHYSIRQGLEKMCYHGYSSIPVLDKDGKYLGTVSEGNFLWYIVRGENSETGRDYQVEIQNFEGKKVSDIVEKGKYPPVKITSDMTELLSRATEQNYVPVVDDRGYFIGLITRRDIIKYFCKNTWYLKKYML